MLSPSTGFSLTLPKASLSLTDFASAVQNLCTTHNKNLMFWLNGDIISSGKPNELCSTASVTKSVAALALFKARECGCLNIDVPISTYLPAWTDWKTGLKAQITSRHLLSHTSGLPGQGRFGGITPANQFNGAWESGQKLSEAARKHETVFMPGSVYDYSNPGTQILSAVLEGALKTKKLNSQDFISDCILKPLKLNDTSFMPHAGELVFYAGMKSSASNLLDIGLLVMNEGIYESTRILGKTVMDEMLSRPSCMPTSRTPYLHLWNKLPFSDTFYAKGDEHSFLFINRDMKMVFSITNSEEPPGVTGTEKFSEELHSLIEENLNPKPSKK